jgi:hypothetical protein
MQFVYLDESGVDDLGGGTSHFVLLGLIVPADNWKNISDRVDDIKSKYGLTDAEVHTAWMARRFVEQESDPTFEQRSRKERVAKALAAIKARAAALAVTGTPKKIKNYRKEVRAITPYLHLTFDERRACLKELATLLSSLQNVRLVAEVISKADFAQGPDSVYEQAFEQVVTRAQFCLHAKHDNGIVISDNNDKAAVRLTNLTKEFHRRGTLYSNIPNIVETPLFVNSTLTSMVQMADLCAYSLRRFVENGETELWDLIEARVDRAGRGTHVGVRHYTGRRQCTCRLCTNHGRR